MNPPNPGLQPYAQLSESSMALLNRKEKKLLREALREVRLAEAHDKLMRLVMG